MEDDLKNKIEALLFASGKFMSDENLALIIGAEVKDVRKGLKALKKEYDERDHSLILTEENKTWKINVREAYLELVRKIVADTELPKSVLETLAVIAWKTPILQAETVKIRGNKCYEHIAQLEEMGFVTKEPEGRSFTLKVTEKFFEYFDVEGDKSLKEIFKDVKKPEPIINEEASDREINEEKGEKTADENREVSEKENILEEESDLGEPQEGDPLTPKEAKKEAEEDEIEEEAEDEWGEEKEYSEEESEDEEEPKTEIYDQEEEPEEAKPETKGKK